METVFEVDESNTKLSEALAAQGVEYVVAPLIEITGRASSKGDPMAMAPCQGRTEEPPLVVRPEGVRTA